MEKVALGIDFGTTTTAVSLRIGEGVPVSLPIGKDFVTPYIPSVVAFPQTGFRSLNDVVVGEDAERSQGRDYVIHSIKRCLGCSGNRCAENRAPSYYWCNGDGRVKVPNAGLFQPSEIAFRVIREAFERAFKIAREHHGIDVSTRVSLAPLNMGCGAAFGLKQRNLLVEAARELGFDVTLENVVEEPILAGLTFSRFERQPEGRVLIYDFGGGSFDTAILDIDRVGGKQRITVVATAGEPWLGGDDIDELIREHFIDQIARQVHMSQEQVRHGLEPVDIWRLRSFAKRAKESLSGFDEFEDSFFSDTFPVVSLELSRSRLHQLMEGSGKIGKSLLDRSFDPVLRVCKLCYAFSVATESDLVDGRKITYYDLRSAAQRIDKVVLVGGVSKMPIVRSAVAKIFGESKIVSATVVEPIVAVAVGAAYPREPEYYSIVYPPIEVILELQTGPRGPVEKRTLFEPYEHYRFHEGWTYSAIPMHRAQPINLSQSYSMARIGFRRMGHDKWDWTPLGSMAPGNYQFAVSLDGQISYKFGTEAYRPICSYPLVHPVQDKIRVARGARQANQQAKEREEIKENEKSMFLEN